MYQSHSASLIQSRLSCEEHYEDTAKEKAAALLQEEQVTLTRHASRGAISNRPSECSLLFPLCEDYLSSLRRFLDALSVFLVLSAVFVVGVRAEQTSVSPARCQEELQRSRHGSLRQLSQRTWGGKTLSGEQKRGGTAVNVDTEFLCGYVNSPPFPSHQLRTQPHVV